MDRPTFPLPKDFFGDVRLSGAEQDAYRDTVDGLLCAALKEEREFARKRQQVDANKWKAVSQKHQLQVYRSAMPTADGGGMLSVGKIEGTLEDLLFGLYSQNQEDMKLSHSYVDVNCRDCAVLGVYESATLQDPFHSAAVKWELTKFPGVGRSKRDWCYLEAIGMAQDDQGQRFAYLVRHSVDRRECPPFHKKAAVRGRVSLTFIYRDIAPGSIGVYSCGTVDPAGELIPQLAVIGPMSTLTSIETSTKCAEAKKLTLLAMANAPSAPVRTGSTCFVCRKGSSMRVSMRACRVCHQTVCNKCSCKKDLFAGVGFAVTRVECCTNCIVRAKMLKARPSEFEFSISAHAFDVRPTSVSNASAASVSYYRSPPESSTASSDGGFDRRHMDTSSQSFVSSDSSRVSQQDHRKSLEILDERELPSEPLAMAIVPVRNPNQFQDQTHHWQQPSNSNHHNSPPFTTPKSRHNSTASEHQEALYLQLLKLQVAAEKVYDTTLANEDLMHRM